MLGQLDQVASRSGVRVTPYVAMLPESMPLTMNPDEIASIFTVPVRYCLENEPVPVTRIRFLGDEFDVPGYYYDDYKIWGLTAFILCDFLRTVFDHEVNFIPPGQRFVGR